MADTYETSGTQFLVSTSGSPGSPDDYVAFCVTSIDPIGSARSLIDVTTLCSTAREYRLALQDGQEINVEAFYDPLDTTQAALRTALEAGTILGFRIILTDESPGTQIDFDGLVMAWNIGAAIDNVYPLRVTIKPTGAISFS
jgi:predicted secreted protein